MQKTFYPSLENGNLNFKQKYKNKIRTIWGWVDEKNKNTPGSSQMNTY